MSGSTPRGSALAVSTNLSTSLWQADLKTLFDHAKERFPDVVWELAEGGPDSREEVWGHKAMVYARAPPSFLAQYFDVRPGTGSVSRALASSPLHHNPDLHTQSTLSLNLPAGATFMSRTPSPHRTMASPSPSLSQGNALLRLTTSISPSLFSNQLEYLYTGRGIGAAFEFLFSSMDDQDIPEDLELTRIDKLRKDLVYMWRSRLYSDIRISLTGPFSPNGDDEETTAEFSSHRFVLVSRTPYFRKLLLTTSFAPVTVEAVTLPSPPFTPASLHFTLGYIYTGTLFFSHRTFDLTTSFHIYRSAIYLELDALQSEIEARIVEEMMHGLFHAYLKFEDYEKVTGGRWGVGGCRCRTCARRAPRVLEFAMAEDVRNPILDRGARRALVGLFGEGWMTAEFAALPSKARATALKGVHARTTPQNAIPLLFAAEQSLAKLGDHSEEPWAEVVKGLILQGRKRIDEVMCLRCEDVFEQEEWLSILERDGAHFDDSDKIQWILESLQRGLANPNAALVYQTLVSSVLLRPHPTSASLNAATLLSSTSPIRSQVEQARIGILHWLRKRWHGVRLANGFDTLDGWALKEISDELEVPVDDLIGPPGGSGPAGSGMYPDVDTDTGSITSLRANVLHRNASRANDSGHDIIQPISSVSPASLGSRAPSVASSSAVSVRRRPVAASSTPSRSTVTETSSLKSKTSQVSSTIPSAPLPNSSIYRTPRSVARIDTGTPIHSPPARPKSLAPSVSSVRSSVSSVRTASTSSTLRRGNPVPRTSNALPAPSPLSTNQSLTSSGTSYVTAPSGSLPRPRTLSALSNASTTSNMTSRSVARSGGASSPGGSRPRRMSTASTASGLSASGSTRDVVRRRVRPGQGPHLDVPKPIPSPRAKRGVVAESRQTVQANSRSHISKTPVLKSSGASHLKDTGSSDASSQSRPSNAVQQGTIRGTPRRKTSNDTIITITASSKGTGATNSPYVLAPSSPNPTSRNLSGQSSSKASPSSNMPLRGITLNIGIPCMISSKRSRFKAFARYIGEVHGELGPWVGVEVPVGESWGSEKLDGRDWHDGSLGGVRYFDIGAATEDGEERAAQRRRMDQLADSGVGLGPTTTFGRKREGDQLSVDQDRSKRFRSVSPAISDMSMAESRGLFVRPQQVLLVIDAKEQN